MSSQLLRLNAFRGEPASSGFEWHFTPNHNSPRFGSISSDNRPMKTRFRYGSGGFHSLNQATAYESPAHSSTGTRSEITFPSHCLGAQHGFTFYFTTHWGFFSPFPHGTTSLSVTQEYLALQGGPFLADSHGIPRAPCYSGQSVS